ncbi:MAG: hypothetical protein WCC30_08755 [Candidatus Dormiibacterota bacterium]
MRARSAVWIAGVLVVGLAIGVAVAVASSLSSLSPDHHQTTGIVLPTPSPVPSPSPTVRTAGLLGDSPRLETNGSNTVIGIGPNVAVASADGGRTWITVQQPPGGSGLAVDASNPRHAISGGSTVHVTQDGGASWSAALKPPPGKGPYQPLAISPIEPSVWFFVHQGRLLVTRDGSSTWADLGGLPTLVSPVLVSGQALGQFFLAAGSSVFQLSNYGQKITSEPVLTQGGVSDLVVVGGNVVSLLARVAGHGAYVLSGSSWVAAGVLSGPVAGGADGAMLVGNGGAKLGVAGVISYSPDGGITWNQATGLPPDQTVDALAGQPASSTFYAYCYGGDIYASVDNGRTWTILSRALRTATG